MLMLVSYDVSTVNASGRRRLKRVAKTCEDWGIRVQNSVFECYLDWSQWVALRAKLESICQPETDSLRYYNLGHCRPIRINANSMTSRKTSFSNETVSYPLSA